VVQVLTTTKVLVCPRKMLGGKGTEQGKFSGKNPCCNYFCKFSCMRTRRFPPTGNP
jgi:hypothetical protein